MKHPIVLILLALSISSCGIFKDITKDKSKSRIDSVETVKVSTSKIDKSTITITEKADTTVKVKGYEQKGEWKLQEQSGELKLPTDTFSLDSSLNHLKIYFDKMSNSIKILSTIKDQLIPIKLDKTIQIHNDIRETSNSNKETDVSKQSKVVNKVSETDYTWILYLVGVISFIALVAFLYNKYKPF